MFIIEELAYSLHLSSDRNKKNISKTNSRNNISCSTSLPNNAIQNLKTLSKVDKHNYRKYDNDIDNNVIIRGTNSIMSTPYQKDNDNLKLLLQE